MRLICVFAILIMNSLSAGEILVTSDFSLVEKEVHKLDKDSLVLFDVDGTLIVPVDAILQPKAKSHFNKLVAPYTDRDLFRDIRLKAPYRLVDDRSVSLVQKLQQRKIPTLAFTAAPAKIRGVEPAGIWRVDELKQHGFDFSSAFPNSNFLEIPKDLHQEHFPMFKSGVLYSSFHHKGDILTRFLKQLEFTPKKVVFVDDELGFVQSVIAALDKLGIPCMGIHYTAAHEAPCDLNLDRASFQVDYFAKHEVWLGDGESKQLLEACK